MADAAPLPMCVRWWTVGGGALGALVGLILRGRLEGQYVGLYGPTPSPKARAFEVADVDWVPSWRGRACGVLDGARLIIDYDGREVTVDVSRRNGDVRTSPRW